MGFRQTETTSATRWVSVSSFPHTFDNGERPKAIFLNATSTVTLIDEDGNSVSFVPAIGIPIQLRPKEIVSSPGGPVICLFD
jgi:hypothetical protein